MSKAFDVDNPFGAETADRAAADAATATAMDDDCVGSTITVTWGKEHVQPCRFQGMDIGPFAMTTVVQDGETPLDAKRRAMRHLNEMAKDEFEQKLPAFLERVRKAEASGF